MTNHRGNDMSIGDTEEKEKGIAVVGGTSRRTPGPTARERSRGRGRHSVRSVPDDREDFAVYGGDEPELHDDEVERSRAAHAAASTRAKRHGARSAFAIRGSYAYLLGLLALASTVAAVGFGLAWSNLNSQNEERQAVKSVATTCLDDLTNFKPSTVDADLSALEACAAPGSLFDTQSAQTFSAGTRQALIQADATYEGQIRNIFVETISPTKAEVYAVLDTEYQNSKVNTPVADTLRVTVDLSNTSQGWRISAITVENPSGTSSTAGGSATGTTTPGG